MKKSIIFSTVTAMFLFVTTGCINSNKENKNKEEDVEETIASVVSKSEAELQGEETLNIANAFMAAMGKGDMEALKDLMHDDMVWQNAGDASLPWMGPWKGKKAILENYFPAFGAGFATKKWVPTDAIAYGDTAAYFGQMIGLLTNSNKETKEFTYALRVKVKDGKIILWNWFEDSLEVSKAYHTK